MATKSAISFGLVHIPVQLHTATTDNDIHFNQLHKEDHERIRYKKICGHCGKELNNDEIIKGFAYEKDKYIIVTNEDFEIIKTDQDRAIQILQFSNLQEISPIFFEKTYHVIPEKGGEKAFGLLHHAMLDEKKVAIAKTVLGTKETLLALIPRTEGLLVQTMFFADEIKELPQNYVHPETRAEELEMAKTLIKTMEQEFAPEKYHDEYQNRLKDLIAQKINGQEVVALHSEPKNKVVDLMEALKASIEQNKEPAQGKNPKATAKRKALA